MPMSREASELEPGFRRPSGDVERFVLGGRWETQSWTRRLTLGFDKRLSVFLDEGFVVMIMIGPDGRDVLEALVVFAVKVFEGR